MPSPLQLQRVVYPAGAPGGSEGSPTLSDDTTLSTFSINDENVGHGQTIQRGNGMTAVNVIAVPAHAGASRTINGDSGADPVVVNLEVGDNAVTVAVTAEDGVTLFDHVVTVRRLTAGLSELTNINTMGIGYDYVTGGAGEGLVISNAVGRIGFWGNTSLETQPDWSAFGVTDYVQVFFNDIDNASTIKTAFMSALNANGFIASDPSGLTIGDYAAGWREDAVVSGALVTAGVVVTVTQQGENPS